MTPPPHHHHARILATAGLLAALGAARGAQAQLTFTEVAREGSFPVRWIDGSVAPALADDGTVLFAAESVYGVDSLYAGDGTANVTGFPVPAPLFDVREVGIDSAGNVAFRAQGGPYNYQGELLGVYTSQLATGVVTTVHEGRQGAFDPDPVGPRNLAMAEGGMFAFSAIRDGHGALYRGVVGGSLEELRSGSGTFYNTQVVDVNTAGTVAVQMEHSDPAIGMLSRGILLFDEPGQAITEVDTAIERLNVSQQPQPAINEAGEVAFYTNTPLTVVYFDPPFDDQGTIVEQITLEPGVYVTTPTPMGQPNAYTQIASTAGGYASFSQVDLNDHGTVVFRATLDAGGNGIFSGPDPVQDAIVLWGQELADTGTFVSYYVMGELNDGDQLSLLTSDWYTADYIIWRVGGVSTCAGPCARLRARAPRWPQKPIPRPTVPRRWAAP